VHQQAVSIVEHQRQRAAGRNTTTGFAARLRIGHPFQHRMKQYQINLAFQMLCNVLSGALYKMHVVAHTFSSAACCARATISAERSHNVT
jgi:hypothetical protein